MQEDVERYIQPYPEDVKALFHTLRELLMQVAPGEITETLWARLPSYTVGEKFVRLIPFKDHINVEAAAIAAHVDALKDYKLTPKSMLQIFVKQDAPVETLERIFRETLQ